MVLKYLPLSTGILPSITLLGYGIYGFAHIFWIREKFLSLKLTDKVKLNFREIVLNHLQPGF